MKGGEEAASLMLTLLNSPADTAAVASSSCSTRSWWVVAAALTLSPTLPIDKGYCHCWPALPLLQKPISLRTTWQQQQQQQWRSASRTIWIKASHNGVQPMSQTHG
jgi:hypothetical protein